MLIADQAIHAPVRDADREVGREARPDCGGLDATTGIDMVGHAEPGTFTPSGNVVAGALHEVIHPPGASEDARVLRADHAEADAGYIQAVSVCPACECFD